MFIEPETPLFNALEACGINPATTEVEWDELCQEDVLTIDGDGSDFTDTMLSRSAELYLTFPSRFVFNSPRLQARFDASVRTNPKMVQAEVEAAEDRDQFLASRGLSDFEPYEPDRETLGEFAMRAEEACGLKPGTAISVSDGQLVVFGPKHQKGGHVLLSLLQQKAPSVNLMLEVG